MGSLQAPRFRLLGWLAVLAMIALAVLGPSASSVAAASVTPIAISGSSNDSCEDLGDTYGHDQSWVDFKLEGGQLANGTYSVGSLSVTISNFVAASAPAAGSFDWTSNFGVDAVYVKTGVAGKNLYLYAPTAASPESFGDTNLQTPTGIGNGFSHIDFCYDLTDPVPPSASAPPPSASTPASTEPSVAPSPSTPASTEPSVAPSPSIPPSPEGSVLASTAVNSPSPAQSAGAVLGATGTPRVTLPPTDTSVGSTPSSGNWRILLVALAGVLAGVLVLTPTARRRS
jgi:hypothetical protein